MKNVDLSFIFMSLLILGADRSADRIGETLSRVLDETSAPFCPSTDLFVASPVDWSKVFHKSLKTKFLSTNDLLGFLLLVDVATSNTLHLKNLSLIESLVRHLQTEHPFQSTLVWIVHGEATNPLYTSALTCFNLNFLLTTIHPFVDGILFHNIDDIVDPQLYHSTVAAQIAGVFRPVSSLREGSPRRIRNVNVEFLQLVQHLLCNPEEKFLLFRVDPSVKKILQRPFQSALLIERGKPSLTERELVAPRLDVWHSLEERSTARFLLINSVEMVKDFLEKLVLQPYERKLNMNKAYLYWLKKKYSIEEKEFVRTSEVLRAILLT